MGRQSGEGSRGTKMDRKREERKNGKRPTGNIWRERKKDGWTEESWMEWWLDGQMDRRMKVKWKNT